VFVLEAQSFEHLDPFLNGDVVLLDTAIAQVYLHFILTI
jgi:hypothetical protein